MPHHNLDPRINALLEQGDNPKLNLILTEVSTGDIISVHLKKENEEAILFFRIIKTAGPSMKPTDYCIAELIYYLVPREWMKSFLRVELPYPLIGQRCDIVGACTKNPDAQLGLTMLHFAHITQGRQMLWYMPTSEDIAWLYWPSIAHKAKLSEAEFVSLKANLEKAEEFDQLRFTEADIVQIQLEIQDEREEEVCWRKFVKQPLEIQTQNSIYLLSQEREGGTRTCQKQGSDDIYTGILIFLRKEHTMIFKVTDKGILETSHVCEIRPRKP